MTSFKSPNVIRKSIFFTPDYCIFLNPAQVTAWPVSRSRGGAASQRGYIALVGCATATPVGTDQIDLRYSVGGGKWNTGGGITIVARAFERNGVTVICGAWTMDRQSVLTSKLNEQVMQAGSVYLGGDRAVQNLSFMRLVPYSNNIAGEQANCVAASLPWKADYVAVPTRVRLPRRAFRVYAESGNFAVFRETNRAEIIQ